MRLLKLLYLFLVETGQSIWLFLTGKRKRLVGNRNMTKLILSTGNIVSGGPSIIRKPGAYRSNLELTNSLRSNFLAAQEDYAAAAADDDGEAQDGKSQANGDAENGAAKSNGNALHVNTATGGRPPVSVWTAERDGVLYIPRIDWSEAGLQEEPSQYNITVKLFFLPSASVDRRAQFAKEALDLVLKELGAPAVDLLIVSFPGMSFEGDCEWEADRQNAVQGNDEEELATWAAIEDLHRTGLAKSIGLAEFGSEKLARFLQKVQVRPAVNQINIKNCCNVPPPLTKLAKEEGIELLAHSDCTDILPEGTLRELLGQGLGGAGILADPDTGVGGLKGDLAPQWVVKYTAVVRDRGVIENKGYFAGAELTEA
ncbi:NADP-dependent oxidoreductase domain-containing protein [Triangularia verruculosa]|uniref:GCS light chain n=1 Tax=Triangularia verruculosa TaxID=2587418 RepID=A0AAN7AX23_9PEZI|nr:NADP-dependent oxidoreductase domain-containing protein [Triangularia verruculosa]